MERGFHFIFAILAGSRLEILKGGDAVLTVVIFLASTTLIAICIQLVWTRIVVNLATEAKERDLDEGRTRHTVEKASTELLAAIGNLHDDLKAERIARGAAEVAARAAERRVSRSAPPLVPSITRGDPSETADVDRETLMTAPPAACVPEAATTHDDDPTTVISREALFARSTNDAVRS